MGRLRGQEFGIFGGGYLKRNRGKRGRGREENLGGDRGVNPGGRGSRPPCPPPL